MNLMRFLLRSSRSIVILSAIAGAAGGAAGIALIALIQRELRASRLPRAPWPGPSSRSAWRRPRRGRSPRSRWSRSGQGAIAELSLHLVRHILVLPLRAFETIDSSALLSALTDDIALIANALVGLPQLCINIPIVIACLVYTGWLAPRSMACGVVFAALAIVAYVIVSARGMKALRRAREQQALLVGHFRTLIGGFRELKLHRGRREAYLAESLEPTMAAARSGHGPAAWPTSRPPRAGASSRSSVSSAFFSSPRPSIEPISRPTLVSAVLVVLYLMTPLDIILTWVPVLGRAQVSLQRIQALIPTLERHADNGDGLSAPVKPLALRDSICLEGVTFTYRDGDDDAGFLLGPIDLTLRPGELVILAGGNGSGKTTLVKLLAGLYRPESGARPDRRASTRRPRSRGLSPALLDRLCRRPSVPRLPRPGLGWDRDAGSRRVSNDWAWRRRSPSREARSRPSTSRRGSGGDWPCWAPCWRIGPSASSTNGPPIRTPRSSRSSITSCCPS